MLLFMFILFFLFFISPAHPSDIDTLFPEPIGEHAGSVTMVHSAPGIDYLSDQRGNSGLSWYSQEDKHGRLINWRYLFDPISRWERE